MPGIWRRAAPAETAQPRRRAADERGQGRLAALDHGRPHPPVRQHLFENTGGSWRCRRRPARGRPLRLGGPGRRRRGRSAAMPKSTVKWNVLPRARLALDPDPAAHHLHEPREIVRPRPVPPYWRVVELSAWVKARRSRACFSARDADAGVAHREVQHDVAVGARRVGRRRVTTTSPCSVNLMALPTRLIRTWRSRPGSPSSTSGTSGATSQTSSSPFWCARSAERLDGVAERVAQVEVDAARDPACPPRSWRSRGCR